MKKLCFYLLFFLFHITAFANVQDTVVSDSVVQKVDFQHAKKVNFNPLIAASEVIVLNAGVHLFDRFILNADWAQVDFHSIDNNFKYGFVWDNDNLSTNTFWHPYHGGLYFNAARTNNLNFWQSIPYSFAGSLMWEYLGENERPSINDFVATSIGGMALGEMTHRISHLVLNDSKRGVERVGREVLAGIISPMGLVNRLLSGKAWHHSPLNDAEKSEYLKEKFVINFAAFHRFMSDLDNNRNHSNAALNFSIIYGEAFADKKHAPYDYFTATIDLNIIGNQPLISNANVVGLLWGSQWEKKKYSFLAGVFQHFNYYNSNPLVANGKLPYEYAETASFGGGFLFQRQADENKPPVFMGSCYANVVLLGASESDHYSVHERNYNFGSGYSVKVNLLVNFAKRFNAFLNVKTYQIFTLNKMDNEDFTDSSNIFSAQGNRGNAHFNMLGVGINCRIIKWLSFNVEQRFFSRISRYKYFDDVSSNSTENRLKLVFSIFDN